MTKIINTDNHYRYDNEAVFNQYYAALCLYASRIVPNQGDAEDAVQEVFVKIIERKVSFISKEHLQNYLYISVRNAALSYMRKEGVKSKYEEFQQAIQDNNVDSEIVEIEVYRQLSHALETLPTECRKIVELTYIQNLDNQTVAQMLGLSVNTVKAQKMRGKKLLREKLKGTMAIVIIPMLFNGL